MQDGIHTRASVDGLTATKKYNIHTLGVKFVIHEC